MYFIMCDNFVSVCSVHSIFIKSFLEPLEGLKIRNRRLFVGKYFAPMAAKIFGDVCLKTTISQNKIHASYLT